MHSPFSAVPVEVVRDFWDRRPCNLRHSPAAIGSRQYFDEVERRKDFVEPHIPPFADFPRWAGKRVLEIGCGLGTDTINFARAGASVTAVDLTPRAIALARQRAEVFGLADRIRFVEADAERLSEAVTPEPYDLVYSFGVIHHSPHPERILREIRTHFTGDATTLKVMVYHRWSWKVLAILLQEARGAWWRIDEAVARNSEAQTGCPVTYIYSPREAGELVGAAGFAVTDAVIDHVFPYRVRDYVEYRYEKAQPFRWLPPLTMRALERRLGWHLCLTARPL